MEGGRVLMTAGRGEGKKTGSDACDLTPWGLTRSEGLGMRMASVSTHRPCLSSHAPAASSISMAIGVCGGWVAFVCMY